MEDLDRFTIESASKGDEKSFRRLYDHYAPFVWRITYRTAGSDRTMAEEIVQETFVRIHRSLKKFGASSSLGTWIYRIAFNTATTFLARQIRHRQTTVPYVDELQGGGQASDGYDASELAAKILGELGPDERFLLVAKEIDGFTFEEIAEITGQSPESLRTRMFRMKGKIKSMTEKMLQIREAVI